MIKLINIKRGDRNFTEFVADVEDQAKLTRADKVKIIEDNLTRMAFIAGCRDRSLAVQLQGMRTPLFVVTEGPGLRHNKRTKSRRLQAQSQEDQDGPGHVGTQARLQANTAAQTPGDIPLQGPAI